MLNPFLQIAKEKQQKKPTTYDESVVPVYGYSLDTSTPQPSIGLWIGRLLIRMGERLTRQDVELNSSRENS